MELVKKILNFLIQQQFRRVNECGSGSTILVKTGHIAAQLDRLKAIGSIIYILGSPELEGSLPPLQLTTTEHPPDPRPGQVRQSVIVSEFGSHRCGSGFPNSK